MTPNRRLTTPPPKDWKTAAGFFLSMVAWILMLIIAGIAQQ
jgi:hypothetical protein